MGLNVHVWLGHEPVTQLRESATDVVHSLPEGNGAESMIGSEPRHRCASWIPAVAYPAGMRASPAMARGEGSKTSAARTGSSRIASTASGS